MTAKSNAVAKLEGELIVTRVLDAMPDTVFKSLDSLADLLAKH